MADLSDSPDDLVQYYRVLDAGYDCAFGTRFGHGGLTRDYPFVKLVINRIVNTAIRVLFRHGYNDTTNAFKAYRRNVIDQLDPLLSNHFNLTDRRSCSGSVVIVSAIALRTAPAHAPVIGGRPSLWGCCDLRSAGDAAAS